MENGSVNTLKFIYFHFQVMNLSMYCPRYHPTGKGGGFDLYEINCLSPGANTRIKCPHHGTVYFPLLSANIDQIPTFCQWGGRWGNTLIGALCHFKAFDDSTTSETVSGI